MTGPQYPGPYQPQQPPRHQPVVATPKPPRKALSGRWIAAFLAVIAISAIAGAVVDAQQKSATERAASSPAHSTSSFTPAPPVTVYPAPQTRARATGIAGLDANDMAYISVVETAVGQKSDDRASLIAGGRNLCHDFETNITTPAGLLTYTKAFAARIGIGLKQAGQVYGAAMSAYCPEQRDHIVDLLNQMGDG